MKSLILALLLSSLNIQSIYASELIRAPGEVDCRPEVKLAA